MPRGEASIIKVHYKGKNDDFLVFVEDADEYKKWKNGDTSIALANFISAFKIFVTHKQGSQGTYDTASKATLSSEFDTEDEDTIIKAILTKGTAQEAQLNERQGVKNDSMGSMAAH